MSDIERLEDRLDMLEQELGDLRSEVDNIRAENARLREALKPFASQKIDTMLSLDDLDLVYKDFLRAREAIS